MNGVHDMGGMQGMGPVEYEKDEPVFHAVWEGRVYALTRVRFVRGGSGASIPTGMRSRVMPPVDYLRMSYYERWLRRLELHVVKYRHCDPGRARERHGRLPGPPRRRRRLTLATVDRWLNRGHRLEPGSNGSPRFKVGQRVRARNINPTGHTRLPRYARGKTGSDRSRPRGLHVSRTPTRTGWARSGSTCTRCGSRRASCGARRLRRATRSTSICGTTILSAPDWRSIRAAVRAAAPAARRRRPVFAEPWQAQAFALAVQLSEQGHFTWKEWAAALADGAQGRGRSRRA